MHDFDFGQDEQHCEEKSLKGMLQEYWKIDMFLETFRLLACAISNFVLSPYKDFLTLDLGTW